MFLQHLGFVINLQKSVVESGADIKCLELKMNSVDRKNVPARGGSVKCYTTVPKDSEGKTK